MIRFHLTCSNDHSFDSWFRSGADCDNLLDKNMVSCTTCGTTQVRKALMAPKVSTSESTAITAPQAQQHEQEHPLAKLKKEIESKADDVGTKFAQEARDMHNGITPERPIYGQATGKEAKDLITEGIPVLPLPFVPTKKTN